MPILPIILALPIVGCLVILCMNKDRPQAIRRVAACATGIPLLLVLVLFSRFDGSITGYQFQFGPFNWVARLGITFHLGLDGINLVLVLLHGFCAFTGTLVSFSIQKRVKEYFIFYLLLVTSVYGVFMSLDLFCFYLFYEMAVIPMFPLIGIWGSTRKEYATMKLTLYLTSGAVLALVGLLVLYKEAGVETFNMLALANANIPINVQMWVFPLLVIGFGAMAPMWPMHSWSPLGHAAAPSAVSMLHAGVLMKLGSYAILRIAITLMPQAALFWMPFVATICIMNILYGGYVAMSQKDLKFIVGYSSSSHMGYVLLGLACLSELGLSGAVLLMFAHGLMTALAFALIGFFYDQTHTRMLPDLGGLAKKLPFVAVCFTIMAMASSGLPGFANFVSEFMIFFAAWDAYPVQTLCAVFGIVITAIYMLRAVSGVFFGAMDPRWEKLIDARSMVQRLPYLILIIALLVVGFWPRILLDPMKNSVQTLVARLNKAKQAPQVPLDDVVIVWASDDQSAKPLLVENGGTP